MKFYQNTNWKEVKYNLSSKQLPADWNLLEIEDIFIPNDKSKIKASDSKKVGTYPFFNCSETQTKYFDTFLVDGENLFITTGGDYMFNLYHNGSASYSTDVWSVKVKNQDAKFIHYFLKSNFYENQSYFRGFKFKHLDKKGFKKMLVSIPNKNEQVAISSILSSQESILLKTKCLISEISKRNLFLMDELLSGRLRVKKEDSKTIFYQNPDDNWKTVEINGRFLDIPNDWSINKVDQLIDIVFGKRITKSKSSGSIPVYGGGNASFFTNTASQKNKWIIGRFALSPNCVRYVKDDFWLLDSGFTFNSKNYNNENFFGFKMLLSQNYIYEKLARGGAQKNIDVDAFKNMELAVPSFQEQDEIVKIINQLNLEKQTQEKILEQEQKTFNFLLNELMSGRLRVEI